MTEMKSLPRLLIIDDLFGRTHSDRRNEERANLCGEYLLVDVTGDEAGRGSRQTVKHPVAEAVFYRGQSPICASIDDTVENDLDGVVRVVEQGWSSWENRWSMVLLDLCFYTGRVTALSNRRAMGMPEGRVEDDQPHLYFGIRILKALRERFPDLPVVILSSKPREEVSREFSNSGALAFLERASGRSVALLQEYIQRHGLIEDTGGEIVGKSRKLLLCLRDSRRAASGRRHLLIRGMRGTGKELLARYLNRCGDPTHQRSLTIVDSGTLSPELYASELFGYRRGAFTGAEAHRQGRIALANGGDLFLDEIGNMPADVQAGLLRVLEQKQVVPLGADTGLSVDVRFLSATNRAIEQDATSGGFRADLLDRLRQGGTLLVPPLLERAEDIPLLAEYFVREAELCVPNAMHRTLDPAAIALLLSHSWPGNVRELRNYIFAAVSSYPDVEHLVPMHFEQIEGSPWKVQPGSAPEPPPAVKPAVREQGKMSELVAFLDSVRFDGTPAEQLAGRLADIQRACGRLLARYLKEALKVTSRPTPAEPAGKIFIQPAIKLMTGDTNLTASKASDIIKRLLRWEDADNSLLSDHTLEIARKKAFRLRPAASAKTRMKKG